MARDGNEPQSYGSGEEWLTGKTGQDVNQQKSSSPPEHQPFYDERRESEVSAPHQGGHTSPTQLADADRAEGASESSDANATVNHQQPVTKVTSKEGGAKQDSFFRKRDYP